MIEVLKKKSIKKARKKHNCSYCSGPINIGDSYEFIRAKYGMEYYEVKAHTYCNTVTQELISSGYFVDDGIGMTTFDYKRCVIELHKEFINHKYTFPIQTMSMDLGQIFENCKLITYNPDGYIEKWILKDR